MASNSFWIQTLSWPLFALLCLSIGCVPSFLEKYQTNHGEPLSTERSVLDVGPDVRPPVFKTSAVPSTRQALSPSEDKVIQKMGDKRYLIKGPYDLVWQTTLQVLIDNYNINIIDRQSGVITTEWDSFYLNNAIFRNKVSLLLKKNPVGSTELLIYNNVEALVQKNLKPVWLPTTDSNDEPLRIVRQIDKNLKRF